VDGGNDADAIAALQQKTQTMILDDGTNTLYMLSDLDLSEHRLINANIVTLQTSGPSDNAGVQIYQGTVNVSSIDFAGSTDQLTVAAPNVKLASNSDNAVMTMAAAGEVRVTAAAAMTVTTPALTVADTALPTLYFQSSDSGNSTRIGYDGVTLALSGDITHLNLNAANMNTIVGGAMTIQAPNGATYEDPAITTVNTEQLNILASVNTAVPGFYYEKVGNIDIDSVNPPSAPLYASPQFIWRFSGANGGGLSSDSGFCSSRFVEVDASVAMSSTFSDGVQLGVVIMDANSGQRFYAENFPSFDSTCPAMERCFTIDSTKVSSGTSLFNWSGNFTSIFDTSAMADGTPYRILLYGIDTFAGGQVLDELRVTFRIRPVRQLAL